jgi:structural maintenance of chromosomes protein 6
VQSIVKSNDVIRAASLSVKIKNQGASAYKPELYGDSIIVERHFSRSGGSGFKIKNAAGRIISTKKSDLEDITDAFALQLDNPMNVLTQDAARQFLNASTPSDKYRFFIKGTQLEQLDHDYRMMEQNLDHTKVLVETQKENVKDLHEKYKEAHRLYEQSQRQGALRDKARRYTNQYIWLQVTNKEKVSLDVGKEPAR